MESIVLFLAATLLHLSSGGRYIQHAIKQNYSTNLFVLVGTLWRDRDGALLMLGAVGSLIAYCVALHRVMSAPAIW